MVAPSSLYPRSAVGLAIVALAASGRSTKSSNNTAGGTTDDDTSTGTSNGPVGLKDGSKVKLALISGGAHPYFQPWKTTAEQDKTELKPPSSPARDLHTREHAGPAERTAEGTDGYPEGHADLA